MFEIKQILPDMVTFERPEGRGQTVVRVILTRQQPRVMIFNTAQGEINPVSLYISEIEDCINQARTTLNR